MCRNDATKRCYGCSSCIEHSLQEIVDDVGIRVDIQSADDLMKIFYLSMDCFFYTTTSDDEFKKKRLSYASLLTKGTCTTSVCISVVSTFGR